MRTAISPRLAAMTFLKGQRSAREEVAAGESTSVMEGGSRTAVEEVSFLKCRRVESTEVVDGEVVVREERDARGTRLGMKEFPSWIRLEKPIAAAKLRRMVEVFSFALARLDYFSVLVRFFISCY